MNITFVAPFALEPKGTVSARMVPLARALIARGHRVKMIVPPWDYPPHSGVPLDRDGVPITNVKLPPKVPFLWYGLLTLSLLREALAPHPDAVYCFKPKGFSGMVAILLSIMKSLRLTAARIVIDTDDWEGEGGWNEVLSYPWWQKKVFELQEKWLLKSAGAVTAASRGLLKMAEGLRGTDASIYYLPNASERTCQLGPEQGAWVKKLHKIEQGPVILLYTRYVEFTPQRIVDIMQGVAFREPGVTLLVVGEGLAQEGRSLEQLWRERGLEARSRLVRAGWVMPEEIPGYMAAADVAIYPMDDTLINRTKCPAKLVELLSAGLPVVAEAVGQAKEYIADQESGVLVEPGDSAAIAKEVARLLRDPEERLRLSEGARKRIEERFLWKDVARVAEEALLV